MQNYPAFINGQLVYTDQTIPIHSPETNQIIGTIPRLSEAMINQAFVAAKAAQKKWAQLSPKTRAKYLLNWSSLIKQQEKQIATLLAEEIAKPKGEGIKEINRSIDYLVETVHEYLDLIAKPLTYDNNLIQMPKTKVGLYYHKPLGVALTISPFNYPINLTITKVVPALITGNTIVHKAATQGSLANSLIFQLLDKVTVDGQKLPDGVVNYVSGQGLEIGDYLVSHPLIDVVSFTGSTMVGKKISQQMVMKPYVLELGGKDAALVLDDADDELTAKEIVKGSFTYSGQRCTAIKRVFITDQKAKTLLPKIVHLTKKLTVGYAANDADITTVINANAVKKAKQLYDDAIKKGGVSLTGLFHNNGNLIYPIIIDHVKANMDLAWIEQFAPILPIIRYQKIDEAIKLINKSEYGLQGSIFSQNQDLVIQLANQIETGTINWNRASSRGPDILPFLAIKNSGFGQQGIIEALKSFTRLQGLVLNDQNKTE